MLARFPGLLKLWEEYKEPAMDTPSIVKRTVIASMVQVPTLYFVSEDLFLSVVGVLPLILMAVILAGGRSRGWVIQFVGETFACCVVFSYSFFTMASQYPEMSLRTMRMSIAVVVAGACMGLVFQQQRRKREAPSQNS